MTNEPAATAQHDATLRRLQRQRRLTRLAMLFERVWVGIWPALGLLGVFLCAALLGLPSLLPPWAHATLLASWAVAVLAALGFGLRHVRLPAPDQADRRLESQAGLQHRPLAVLTDRPVLPGAEALWQAHVARAAAVIGRLRVKPPHPGLAAHDRMALRAALGVALFACLVISGEAAPARLARAFTPGWVAGAASHATQIQAWITPPAFTGLAPLFLKPDNPAATVPAGSHLTVSVTGGSGEPTLSLAGKAVPFKALDTTSADAGSFQADADLPVGGHLALDRHGSALAAWDIAVVADAPPLVRFPQPPGASRPNSRIPPTRLPWEVSHAYGVSELHAEFRLRDRPDAAPLDVTIPLPGGTPKSAHGVRIQDLTPHPWAGLAVIARLVARDAPGLIGTSDPAEMMLPERRFQNPVARQLMEVRKMLSVHPDQRSLARVMLDQVSQLDDAWSHDTGGFLNLRAAAAQLTFDREAAAVDEVQQRLWQLALHLEEGAPERTAQELAQARQALREAMEADKRGEKVDPAELDRRLREVQEALQRHFQALAEQARRDPTTQQFDPDAQQMDARDMERLANEAREAAKAGKMDEARDKLAELDQMLDAMQNARPEHGKMTERERQRAQKRQRGQQQMNALQDIVRREGALLDHAQARAEPGTRSGQIRRPFTVPRFDDPAAPPAEPSPAQQTERAGEQNVQQALRRALGELMQIQGDLTGQIPPNLGEADTAMRDATQALAQTNDAGAAGAEQRAIEALQKGGQSMSQMMARQFGQPGQEEGDEGDEAEGEQDGPGTADGQPQDGSSQGGRQYGRGDHRGTRPWDRSQSGDRRADERRDPLGRPLHEGTAGSDESSDVQVPDQMEAARTRAIQEELRRRGAERSRPQPELDYIDRLLRQF